ncbi:hypothetical protein NDI47_16120 [Microcoleus vaginatus GB1-A2]|uniref:hypothetical protein n=1 Tax=Microcoleus vaginatus TaxID=119532 RepID=UPI0016862ED0|nr:hypothetical protein [Microcoleus sp. FACHB-61]
MAPACDFRHTSILHSRLDLHPIAQGSIFPAAKKPRVDIPQLLEATIAWMHSWAEVKRQKVQYPASVRREFLLYRTFSFRMPSLRGAMEWAIRDFLPCERFLLTSD